MKRTVIEISAGAAVLLVLGYFHAQLNRLDQSHDAKGEEICQLETQLSQARLLLGDKERQQASQNLVISDLKRELAQVSRDCGTLKEDLTSNKDSFKTALAQVARQRAELASKIAKLENMEEGWGTVARNSMRVEGLLKTQEATLRDLQTNLNLDRKRLRKDLLGPSVQLSGPETVGSGTIVHSRKTPKGKGWETYIFTSYHVVRNIFKDIGDNQEKVITVTVYRQGATREYKADMVAHKKDIDIALLKMRTGERFANVARLTGGRDLARVGVFSRIVAVGCPLGNDPIPTQGTVTHLASKVEGANYWMINAPTYLGNSGGGVFLADSCRLLGVFSKIYTHGTMRPSVVPHLGLCTPMPGILKWLAKTDYSFIAETPKNTGAELAREGSQEK